MIYFLVGDNADALISLVSRDANGIIDQIKREQIERHRATAFAVKGENMNARRILATDLRIDLTIPNDYQLIMQDSLTQTAWLRQDEGVYTNNIMVRKIPYESREQLSPDSARELLENTGARYVKSGVEGSFKKIDDVNVPLLMEPTTVNNNFALEMRGVWEMENDAMAGPFVAYLIHSPADGELLLAEGFIFAPGEDKRDYMEQLDMLLRGIRFL